MSVTVSGSGDAGMPINLRSGDPNRMLMDFAFQATTPRDYLPFD